jgi:hypothetical protein
LANIGYGRGVGFLGTRLLAALAVSSALVACGGSSSSNSSADAANVKQTITKAFRALATGDGATLCSLATPEGQKTLAASLPHASCSDVVKLVSEHLSAQQKAGLESITIKKVQINGNQATVREADISSTQGTLKGFLASDSPPTKLTKESDGTWKLSG